MKVFYPTPSLLPFILKHWMQKLPLLPSGSRGVSPCKQPQGTEGHCYGKAPFTKRQTAPKA